MGCQKKAFGNCARLIMGYHGEEPKTGKHTHQGTLQMTSMAKEEKKKNKQKPGEKTRGGEKMGHSHT